jgi:hypothetical protein
MPGKSRSRTTAKKSRSKPTISAQDVLATLEERGGVLSNAELRRLTGEREPLTAYDALVAAGYEIGKHFVRRPLERQIEELVRTKEVVTLSNLAEEVAGATSAEAKAAATALIQRRRLKRIVRDDGAALTTSNADVLDARELERLASALKILSSSLRAATKQQATLLRTDVRRILPITSVSAERRAETAVQPELGRAIDHHREPSGLTFVPKLVRALGGLTARDAVHAELMRGARDGRFELRPESGMGRLSTEDAALCLPGPQGSRLSWVRRIEDRG